MSDSNESSHYKKQIPRESIVPEVINGEIYTDSEFARDRIKRKFHTDVRKKNQKVPIDWAMFEKMCIEGMMPRDIAARLGVSRETLRVRCKEEYMATPQEIVDCLSADRKLVLMNKLWEQALKKNNTYIMTFMAKHKLKMYERKMEIEIDDGEEDVIKEVHFKPAIKTMDGSLATEDQVKGWMDEFFDKPSTVETADE